MIGAGRQHAPKLGCLNVDFLHATTHDLAFAKGYFDLAYSRRGPTSIVLHTEILKPGGLLLGLDSEKLDLERQRLDASGLEDVTIEEFEASEVFPTLADFSAFWSRMPGHPDYSLPSRVALSSWRQHLVHALVYNSLMATFVNIHEAKTHLSKLLERVSLGEEITIAKAGKPIARLCPLSSRRERSPGGAEGLDVPDGFFEPLPKELRDMFDIFRKTPGGAFRGPSRGPAHADNPGPR